MNPEDTQEKDVYTPSLTGGGKTRNQLISDYFHLGYTHKEIVGALNFTHNIKASLSTVSKVLYSLGLRRKFNAIEESPLEEVACEILNEQEKSGSDLGYRSMWNRLKRNKGLYVTRDTVMGLMRELDPEGVECRKKRRIRRRKYVNPGPNHTWHIDGYDKLKPFGFCIHGAIDGFSRRIMWLEVSNTNNNPDVIADYYLKCIKSTKVVPRTVRADLGTENKCVEVLQYYFRTDADDEMARERSFLYGKSTSNQRIESWWSMFKRLGAGWWASFFKDLRDSGNFNNADPIHVECIRFAFMKTLQLELDMVREEWNLHNINSKKNQEVIKGKPDVLYFQPESVGRTQQGFPIEDDEVEMCREIYAKPKDKYGCSSEFLDLLSLLLPQPIAQPESVDDAITVYHQVIHEIRVNDS